MHREGGDECGYGVRLVSCSLKELSNCSCLETFQGETQSSSNRRKKWNKSAEFEPADMLAELSAKKVLLNRQPTVLDRLIIQNRTAMALKRKKAEEKTQGKRKNEDSLKNQPRAKKIKKNDQEKEGKPNNRGRKKPPDSPEEPPRSTRKTTKPKVLRSGRKMVDILKQKRNGLKNFAQLSRKIDKRKMDTNSNVFSEKNDDKIEAGTVKNVKRKRRKRCSMYHTVIKRKKQRTKRESPVKEDEEEEDDDDESEENEIPKIENEESSESKPVDELSSLKDSEFNDEKPILENKNQLEIEEKSPLLEPEKEIKLEINTEKVKNDSKDIEVDENVTEKMEVDNNLELTPKKETLDADSTSDVSQALNDSVSELCLSIPEDDLISDSKEDLPDSTKVEKPDEKPAESQESKPCESHDLDKNHEENSEEHDEVNDIDEQLLAQVQTQLEEQELQRNLKMPKTPEEEKPDEVQDVVESKEENRPNIQEITNEQKQMKESVLQALGLKSAEEKPQKRSEGYTGTLKAIIKLNRFGDKKQRMIYKRAEGISSNDKLEYKICSELSQEDQEVRNINQNKNGNFSMYTASLSNSPNEDSDEKDISEKESLIIPEKSSSFSIHPGKLCSDVCTYCFGKFGSLDTPCHVAQLKGEERQRKILENEPHLTGESCLCDACYRYVDRKANFPSKSLSGNGSSVKASRLTTLSECCVVGCKDQATRTIKRKWLIKLKRNINHKLEIDTDKPVHGIYYPLCTRHHNWVEYLTVCGICRRRLNRNNLFSLGLETDRLNLMLAEDGIPARLSDNLFLCKLCRYYSDLRLKYSDTEAIPPDKKAFYRDYRRKILLSLDIALSESDDDSIDVQGSDKKEASKNGDVTENESKDKDMMSLQGLATLLGDQPQQQARIQVKFGNVNIGTLSNLNIGQQGNSATSKPSPQLERSNSPALSAQLDYQGTSSPDGYWEKYTSTIMFDKNTKQLWTELQRPYGSQSSFLRHLVMLEKVWRAGHLVLTPDADERAVKYITSAKNRINSFDGTPVEKKEKEKPPEPQTPPPPTPPQLPKQPINSEVEVVPVKKTETPKPAPPKMVPTQPDRPPRVSIHQRPQIPQISQIPQYSNQMSQMSDPVKEFYKAQQMMMKKKITPLDRAKSLVRMAHPLHQQYYLQHQRLQQANLKMNNQSQPPPLLKLSQPFNARPILPKLPKNLTVLPMPSTSQFNPPTPAAITLKHSGITIEKQVAPARHQLPIEKPSISVFREPSHS